MHRPSSDAETLVGGGWSAPPPQLCNQRPSFVVADPHCLLSWSLVLIVLVHSDGFVVL